MYVSVNNWLNKKKITCVIISHRSNQCWALVQQDIVLSVLEAVDSLQTNADTCKCLHGILCLDPLAQVPSPLELSCPPFKDHKIRGKAQMAQKSVNRVGDILENLRLLHFKEQQTGDTQNYRSNSCKEN